MIWLNHITQRHYLNTRMSIAYHHLQISSSFSNIRNARNGTILLSLFTPTPTIRDKSQKAGKEKMKESGWFIKCVINLQLIWIGCNTLTSVESFSIEHKFFFMPSQLHNSQASAEAFLHLENDSIFLILVSLLNYL